MQTLGPDTSKLITVNVGQDTSHLNVGESMIGTFSTRTEIDTVSLHLTAGTTYRIELAPADDTAASVYDPKISGFFDPNGTSLGLSDNDSGAGNAALLVFTATTSGNHQLKVTPQSQSSPIGNYRVTVSELGPLTDDYIESIETTGKIELGETITGTIETAADKDYIAVTLKAGTNYAITLTGDDAGKLGDLSGGKIAGFFNTSGEAVPDSTYRTLSGTVGEQLEFTPDTDGTFYVAIGGNGSSTGDYYLSVSKAGHGVDAFQETHLVPKTGDNNIDAFLDFNKAWGPGDTSTDYIVTYSFPTALSEFSRVIYGLASEPSIGYSSVTAAEKDTFRGLLQQVSDATNVEFVEVPDTGSEAGTIRLAWSNMQLWAGTRPAFGWAHLPDDAIWGGDMWLNRGMHSGGSGVNQTIIHELGHALGLSHSNRSVAVDSKFSGWEYSIMTSFKTSAEFPSAVTTDLPAQTFMWLDIQALLHIYGKSDATTGENSFSYNTSSRYFQTIWDAGGTDEIIITGNTAAIIDLTPGSWIDVGTTLRFTDNTGTQVGTREATVFIAPDTVIENVVGGSGNDQLIGNSAANTLHGNAGNDAISADAGHDLITGGAGRDTMRGEAGNDSIYAGAGDNSGDIADGGTGNDIIGGGAGNDTLIGGQGSDIHYGGSGSDIIITGSYTDVNNDGIASLTEANTNETDDEIVWAGSGNDSIRAGNGHDILGSGPEGDDVMAYGGNDVLYGGSDAGSDTLDAGSGNDTIFGAGGNDQLLGGTGSDLIYNGTGDDIIVAGDGDDTLYAGPGDDTLTGGDDSDRFEILANNGNDVITDFDTANDILILNEIANFRIIGDITSAASNTTQNGTSGLLISFTEGNSLFLTGITMDTLEQVSIDFT